MLTLNRRLLLAWASAALAGCDRDDKKGETIRVSAIPDENPTELMRKFQPLVEFLQKALGAKVEYVPVIDYGAAVQALAAGKVDFAWLGAFTFVQASYQAEVVPLCMREIDRHFQSVFIASAASGAGAVADLKGKSFAFGSKSSTSGHLMPRHFLGQEFEIDPDKHFAHVVFSGSHDATVKMVESGQVDGGAVNILVWKRMLTDHLVDAAKVKVVWTTPGFVDYVWAARKAVPELTRDRFRDAFLGLAPGGEDDRVLALQDAKKFVAASPDDFAAVERVALATGLLAPKQ